MLMILNVHFNTDYQNEHNTLLRHPYYKLFIQGPSTEHQQPVVMDTAINLHTQPFNSNITGADEALKDFWKLLL